MPRHLVPLALLLRPLVRPEMLDEVVLPTERAEALRTVEWLLLGVCSEMPLEMLQPLKLTPAEVERAFVNSIFIVGAIGSVRELRRRLALPLDRPRTITVIFHLACPIGVQPMPQDGGNSPDTFRKKWGYTLGEPVIDRISAM